MAVGIWWGDLPVYALTFHAERGLGVEPDMAVLTMTVDQVLESFLPTLAPDLRARVEGGGPEALARFVSGQISQRAADLPRRRDVRGDEARPGDRQEAAPPAPPSVAEGGPIADVPTQADLWIVETNPGEEVQRAVYRNMFLHGARVLDDAYDPILVEVSLADVRRYWAAFGEITTQINTARVVDPSLVLSLAAPGGLGLTPAGETPVGIPAAAPDEPAQGVTLREWLEDRLLRTLPGQPTLHSMDPTASVQRPPVYAWGANPARVLDGIARAYGMAIALKLNGTLALDVNPTNPVGPSGLDGGAQEGDHDPLTGEGVWAPFVMPGGDRYQERPDPFRAQEVIVVGGRWVYTAAVDYCIPVLPVPRFRGTPQERLEWIDATPAALRELAGVALGDAAFNDRIWLELVFSDAPWPAALESVPTYLQETIRRHLFRVYRTPSAYQNLLPVWNRAEVGEDGERLEPYAEVFWWHGQEIYLGRYSTVELEEGSAVFVPREGETRPELEALREGELDELEGETAVDPRLRQAMTEQRERYEALRNEISRLEGQIRHRESLAARATKQLLDAAAAQTKEDLAAVVSTFEPGAAEEVGVGILAHVLDPLIVVGNALDIESLDAYVDVEAIANQLAEQITGVRSAHLQKIEELKAALEQHKAAALLVLKELDPADALKQELATARRERIANERSSGTVNLALREQEADLSDQINALEIEEAKRHVQQVRTGFVQLNQPRRKVPVQILDARRGIFEVDDLPGWVANPHADDLASTHFLPLPVRLVFGTHGEAFPAGTRIPTNAGGQAQAANPWVSALGSTLAADPRVNAFFAGVGSITPLPSANERLSGVSGERARSLTVSDNPEDAAARLSYADPLHPSQVFFTFTSEDMESGRAGASDLALRIELPTLEGRVELPARGVAKSNREELLKLARAAARPRLAESRVDSGTLELRGPHQVDCGPRISGVSHELRGNGIVTTVSFESRAAPFDGMVARLTTERDVPLVFGIQGVEGFGPRGA